MPTLPEASVVRNSPFTVVCLLRTTGTLISSVCDRRFPAWSQMATATCTLDSVPFTKT